MVDAERKSIEVDDEMATALGEKRKERKFHLDYVIKGGDLQLLIITLYPGQTIIAEAGALNFMEQGIKFETKLGDGSKEKQDLGSKLLGALSRALTNESLFVTHFGNCDEAPRAIGLASPYPGSIVPIDLKECDGEIICQKDAFIAANKGTSISVAFTKKVDAIFFGGEGFVLQKLKGEGTAFLHAGGTITKRVLNNEEIVIDTGSLVAFTKDLKYNARMVRSMKSMLFAQEGMFLTTLSGTGEVWIQSLPFNRLVANIVSHIPSSFFNKNKG